VSCELFVLCQLLGCVLSSLLCAVSTAVQVWCQQALAQVASQDTRAMLLSLLQPLLAMALTMWCDVGVDTAWVLMTQGGVPNFAHLPVLTSGSVLALKLLE
jgi:hypothetical protein